MLVLNTNNQENTGGLYSNHMLYSYPDFNHVLIYPNTTISSIQMFHTPSGYTVNGLPVDAVDTPLRNQNIKNGTSAGGNVGTNRYMATSQYSASSIITSTSFTDCSFNSTYRFATIGKCKGGEIVGKNFTFMPVCCYDGAPQLYIASTVIQNITAKLTFARGLIHTDGTKEEIGNKTYEHYKVPVGNPSNHYINWLTGARTTSTPLSDWKSGLITGTSEGGIAQEGDSVYVEMKRNIDGKMRLYSTSYAPAFYAFYYCYFGYQGTPKDENESTYARPFQISIE